MPKNKNTDNLPICQFCAKPITRTPVLTLRIYKDLNRVEEVVKDVMLHPTRCPVKMTAKYMQDIGYVYVGASVKLLRHAGIPLKIALRKTYTNGGWGPEWAASFAKVTRNLDNDARHTALHTCAVLKDESKQKLFATMVRLGGEKALFQVLGTTLPVDFDCLRCKRFIKRMKKVYKDEQ